MASSIQYDFLEETGEALAKQVVRYENKNKKWKRKKAMGKIG
jgi:hypothetical protein